MPTHGLVLVAAGASTRFGGGVSKVLVEVAGAPLLVHSARAVRAALGTTPTVVTARGDDLEAVRELARRELALAGTVVVEGGATRQESVARGLGALPAGIDVVLVHDAARPCVTPALVRAVAEAAWKGGAAAPALPLADTVHRFADGRFTDALPREGLRRAQTPQGAKADLLRRAVARAIASGSPATDEVSVLLAAGIRVTAVEGDPENEKVTTRDDLERARARLSRG